MPKLSETTEDTAVPKKRAPRKRAPKADDSSVDTVVSPRPRTRRVTRATDDERDVSPRSVAQREPERKAPTPIATNRQSKKRQSRALVFGIGLAVILTATGVVIGMTDKGQIDVVAVVNERNEKINRGEVRDSAGNVITATTPVQDNRPNGGLVPADPSSLPPPVPVPVPTATTTDVATTSDESTSESDTTEGDDAIDTSEEANADAETVPDATPAAEPSTETEPTAE